MLRKISFSVFLPQIMLIMKHSSKPQSIHRTSHGSQVERLSHEYQVFLSKSKITAKFCRCHSAGFFLRSNLMLLCTYSRIHWSKRSQWEIKEEKWAESKTRQVAGNVNRLKNLQEVEKDPRPRARLCPAHRLRLQGQTPSSYSTNTQKASLVYKRHWSDTFKPLCSSDEATQGHTGKDTSEAGPDLIVVLLEFSDSRSTIISNYEYAGNITSNLLATFLSSF